MLCELVLQQLFTEKVQMLFTTEGEKSPRTPTIKPGNTGYNPPVLQKIPFRSGEKMQKFELSCVSSH